MMTTTAYKHLAERLHALPNGFPPTDDGVELQLLAKLFTPEEAELAAQLRITLETPAELAERLGSDLRELRNQLKNMARRGLVTAGRAENGLGYGLMPFVVGIYEMQVNQLDEETAQLFEDYYQQAFGESLRMQPPVHRVIPIGESVRMDIEVKPFESATDIVNQAQSWGLIDCICRKQKALIGDPCHHPIDICMVFSDAPGRFDNSDDVRALTQKESLATLQRAADAGLVHTVGNHQQDITYICNCCTCSCGILRGIAEVGMTNVVARSAFVNTVDDEQCLGCGECVSYCQFDALAMQGDTMGVDTTRCVGCGVCIPHCSSYAMSLERLPESDIKPVPNTEEDWRSERAAHRGINLNNVL